MIKIYTKTGDKGMTGLIDGSRISKADIRIEALGSLDEVNASIGIIVSQLKPNRHSSGLLLKTQSHIFTCGSRLAEPGEFSSLDLKLPTDADIAEYESDIDMMTKKLPELTQFILPGGTELAAHAHLTRALVRRAERDVVNLKQNDIYVDEAIVQFLNRLSDWLFTLARWYNFEANHPETIWMANN